MGTKRSMVRAFVTIAAIDIGSNSVRLLILDGEGVQVIRESTVTGLGRGVDATGRFRDDTVAATLDVIRSYRATMADCGVNISRAVATSASRDAVNGAELMIAISQILGTTPEIISGDVEAQLAFAGATAQINAMPPFLVIDIGGGSTEFVYGESTPTYAASIDIGSVRLTDRLLPTRPPTAMQLVAASSGVDALFSTVALPGTPRTVIGSAGTFTSLAAVSLGLDTYDRDAVHESTLSRHDIKGLIFQLSGLTVTETAAIPALDPNRAPVILAGAVLADRAAVAAGTDHIVVSEYGLLNAVATSLLAVG
jgi:exopolyphosphatase/guanosine-5'-triphosphate,3'-diphosphate pyrophosphatase